jgi:translation elongation factor EF-G
VLTVNKMDRCFLELQQDGEQAYSSFLRVIESANVLMSTYADEQLGDTQVYPEKGTVCFSAGLHNWAFTLGTFAKARADARATPHRTSPADVCSRLLRTAVRIQVRRVAREDVRAAVGRKLFRFRHQDVDQEGALLALYCCSSCMLRRQQRSD